MSARKIPPHDVDRLKSLLLWAREKGFKVGPIIEIGEVKLHVLDIRQTKLEPMGGPAPEEDRGVYGEHGIDEDDVPAEGTV